MTDLLKYIDQLAEVQAIHGYHLGILRETARAANRRLQAACQNVVTSCPSEETTDPAFWAVREQCRLALDGEGLDLLIDVEAAAKEERLAYSILAEKANAILAIAGELAAKHVRGEKACSACGAAAYMGTLEHNGNCPVIRLESFK